MSYHRCVSTRLVWTTVFEEDLDRVYLLPEDKGALVSIGSKTMHLDEAGLHRWTVTLKGPVVGLGFSSREDSFFIAHEGGLRIVNRIGVTIKEVPLESPPVGFALDENAVLLSENDMKAFSREGRELWMTGSGGSHLTSFKGKLCVGKEGNVILFERSGKQLCQIDLNESLVSLDTTRELAVAGLRYKYLFLTEDCRVASEHTLDDSITALSADKNVAIALPHKVVLYDLDGNLKWTLPVDATWVFTRGEGIAVASGKKLSYYEDVGDKEVLYEIICRGESRCGTFVSSTYVRTCPKCRSERITMRITRKTLT